MTSKTSEYILRFQSQDQLGIVAAISTALWRSQANIIHMDQYSEDDGQFFMRLAFSLSDRSQLEELRRHIQQVSEPFRGIWSIYDMSIRPRMGILVSKPAHCLKELLYLWESGELAVDIPFVISNHADHEEYVRHHGIPYMYIPSSTEDRKEAEILSVIKDSTDFLVLARYMQILSADFLKQYNQAIINIHHSFLPSFKGANPYKQAHDAGVKIIGATAHYVTPVLDEGPIIAQEVTPVSHQDTVASLKQKGARLERQCLSQAVHAHVNQKISIYQGRSIVFNS